MRVDLLLQGFELRIFYQKLFDIVVLNESIDLADHIVKLIVQHAKLIMPLCIIIGGRWSMVLAGIPLIIIDFLYQRAQMTEQIAEPEYRYKAWRKWAFVR